MKRAWFVLAAAIALVVIGSVAVWQLSGDDPRIAAVTAADEPVALTWRGPWSADARYTAGQVVSHGGSSYVASRTSSGSPPDTACVLDCAWAVMARRGAGGPTGPSDVYRHSSNVEIEFSGNTMNLASMPLPAGSYAVTASFRLGNDSSAAGTVGCYLHPGTGTTLFSRVDGQSQQDEVIVHSVEIASPTNLVLQCLGGSTLMWAKYVRIVAVKVGGLTTVP
jgi:hypothetical protein